MIYVDYAIVDNANAKRLMSNSIIRKEVIQLINMTLMPNKVKSLKWKKNFIQSKFFINVVIKLTFFVHYLKHRQFYNKQSIELKTINRTDY